jgi:hypothetical protein
MYLDSCDSYSDLLHKTIGLATELNIKNKGLKNEGWNLDINDGTISFDSGAVYDIQILGTYSELSKKWSWLNNKNKRKSKKNADNSITLEDLPERLLTDSTKLFTFGHKNGLDIFTESKKLNFKKCQELLSLSNVLLKRKYWYLAQYSETCYIGLLLEIINDSDSSSDDSDKSLSFDEFEDFNSNNFDESNEDKVDESNESKVDEINEDKVDEINEDKVEDFNSNNVDDSNENNVYKSNESKLDESNENNVYKSNESKVDESNENNVYKSNESKVDESNQHKDTESEDNESYDDYILGENGIMTLRLNDKEKYESKISIDTNNSSKTTINEKLVYKTLLALIDRRCLNIKDVCCYYLKDKFKMTINNDQSLIMVWPKSKNKKNPNKKNPNRKNPIVIINYEKRKVYYNDK